MKKIFAFISSFLIVCLLAFSGCSAITLSDSSSSGSEWNEVQSITYYTDSISHTYTSTIYRSIGQTEIQQDEYDNAPKEQKKNSPLGFLSEVEIDINRQNFLSIADKEIGVTYFTMSLGPISSMNRYYKYLIISYEIRYVKIKLAENDHIEVNYYDNSVNKTIDVKPSSYEITYFED